MKCCWMESGVPSLLLCTTWGLYENVYWYGLDIVYACKIARFNDDSDTNVTLVPPQRHYNAPQLAVLNVIW